VGEKGSSGADVPPEVDTKYVHEKERKRKRNAGTGYAPNEEGVDVEKAGNDNNNGEL
jgi:hypothetical protein